MGKERGGAGLRKRDGELEERGSGKVRGGKGKGE